MFLYTRLRYMTILYGRIFYSQLLENTHQHDIRRHVSGKLFSIPQPIAPYVYTNPILLTV